MSTTEKADQNEHTIPVVIAGLQHTAVQQGPNTVPGEDHP